MLLANARTGCEGRLLRTARRLRVASVPLAACEPAEGDESDHGDDQPEQEAPEDRHNDPNDHEDAAERYPADSTTTTFRSSHAFSLRVGSPPRHSDERRPSETAARVGPASLGRPT